MKVVDIERVVILMRFIQYGWSEERKKAFDENLRIMLETQCEDLSDHDKQIRAVAYQQGATDMEKAKQIIIDSLLKQIEQIRAEVIDEIKQSIHEIHKCQFYCMEEYCKYEEPTSHDCVECLYIAMQSCLEQLKEQK